MRQAKMSRKTKETDIAVSIKLDSKDPSSLQTGIGFFDHMLDLFAKHAQISLQVHADGDLTVDGHHTIEDIGIVMGEVIARALGDKRGVERYGHKVLPMDEALLAATLDLSGRPFLVFNADFDSENIGDFPSQMTEEFFRALAFNAGMTLHLQCLYGKNDHHKIEGLFKAFAHAFRQAIRIDEQLKDTVMSTKGSL